MTDIELVQSQLKALHEQQEALMKIPRIKKYLGIVENHVKDTQGRDLSVYEKRNVAQCLYNAIIDTGLKAGTRLFETTTEDNIAFLGIQLPVIAALLPSLALSEIAVVQAMDRRIAAVFYLDVKYGSSKGAITKGDVMIGAKTGHSIGRSGRRYAMARVVDESLGMGDGIKEGTLAYAALINLENIKIESVANIGTINETRTLLGSSNESGEITGDYIEGTGSVDTNGAYYIVVAGTASSDDIRITYDYQYDLVEDAYGNKTGVPETDVSVTQSVVEAIDFPLRAKYSIGAQIDLMKAHGIDLESELIKYLGAEVKFTIDQVGLDMIDDAAASSDAASTITDWDARPGLGEPWKWKKEEFLDRIEQGSNNIFEKTKRGVGNFIHCGNNVARVIRQLTDIGAFNPRKGVTDTPTGPMVIGTLGGRTVVQNPFKRRDYYTVGFRGPSYLYAGFIYCPYIPLFTTPTLITSDLIAQKGFLSSAGFKVINAGLFCQGQIKNLAGGYQT